MEWAASEDTAAVLDDLSFLTSDDEDVAQSGTAPADDEPFPWEISETEDLRTSAAPQDSWVTDANPVEAAPAGVEEEADGHSAEPAGAAEADENDRPAPAAQADDEDLESFQAWLRSLKR